MSTSKSVMTLSSEYNEAVESQAFLITGKLEYSLFYKAQKTVCTFSDASSHKPTVCPLLVGLYSALTKATDLVKTYFFRSKICITFLSNQEPKLMTRYQ